MFQFITIIYGLNCEYNKHYNKTINLVLTGFMLTTFLALVINSAFILDFHDNYQIICAKILVTICLSLLLITYVNIRIKTHYLWEINTELTEFYTKYKIPEQNI